jgi:hypothetical protein
MESNLETTENVVVAPKKRKSKVWIWIVLLFLVAFYFVFGFVTIQPLDALPDGVTLLVVRAGTQLKFFDSPDALCMRTQGGVSLLCRMAALNAVAENSTIVLRLPYVESFYRASTGGVTFDN